MVLQDNDTVSPDEFHNEMAILEAMHSNAAFVVEKRWWKVERQGASVSARQRTIQSSELQGDDAR